MKKWLISIFFTLSVSLISSAENARIVCQAGHSGRILACDLYGKYLATAGQEGSVKVWDIETGDVLYNLATGGSAFNVFFSPDGNLLAYASIDGKTEVFDLSKGKVVREFEGTDWWDERYRGTVYISPSWKYIGIIKFSNPANWPVKCNTVTEMREYDSYKLLWTHKSEHSSQCIDIRFSPDEQKVALGFRGYEPIKLFDIVSGKMSAKMGESYVYFVEFSPDGKVLATCNRAGRVTWWDTETGNLVKNLRIVDIYNWSLQSRFSSDGKLFVSGHDRNQIRFWDSNTAEQLCELDALDVWPEGGGIADLKISKDNKSLVAVIGKAAGLWDVSTRKLVRVFGNEPKSLLAAKISADNRYIAFGGSNGEVTLWDAESGKNYSSKISSAAVNSISFSPDNNFLLCGWENGTIEVLSVPELKQIRSLTIDDRLVLSVKWARNGKYIAASNWDDKIWIFKNFKLHRTFNNDPDLFSNHAHDLSFSPDSRFIAASSRDGFLRVWDIESRKLIFKKKVSGDEVGPMDYDKWIFQRWLYAATFSDNGKLIAVGQWGGWKKGYVKVYNLETEELLNTFETHKSLCLSFVPEKEILVSGGNDNKIRLFDLKNGREIFELSGHGDFVTDICCSDKHLVSASWDGTAKVWDLDSKRLVLTLLSPEGAFIAYTPEGYYQCSEGAKKHIRFSSEGKTYTPSQYESKFRWGNRPEKVKLP